MGCFTDYRLKSVILLFIMTLILLWHRRSQNSREGRTVTPRAKTWRFFFVSFRMFITSRPMAMSVPVGPTCLPRSFGVIVVTIINWFSVKNNQHNKQIYLNKNSTNASPTAQWTGRLFWSRVFLGMTAQETIESVTKGYRLPNPADEQKIKCPANLYDRMLQCWQKSPNDRPTFAELRNFFYKFCAEFDTYEE